MDLLSPEILAGIDNPAAVAGFLAAVVVGIASSVHCFAMCGPLACSGLATFRNGDNGQAAKRKRRAITAAYQLGRLGSYSLVGALLGLVGASVSSLLSFSIRPYLPWVMAATLVVTALELGKKLPSIPGLGRAFALLGRLTAKLSPIARSATIGALTPLLPCGLLYGISAAALATGAAGSGALVMGGFALGSGPALLLAQIGLGTRRLPPLARGIIQRGIPLVAAAVLVYRAIGSMGGEPPACH